MAATTGNAAALPATTATPGSPCGSLTADRCCSSTRGGWAGSGSTRRWKPSARTPRSSAPAQFRAAFARGTAPVKARLLDQDAIAGIGNLLADQILWQARIWPARPVGELTSAQTDRMLRALRRVIADAVADGGVHTLSLIPFRRPEAACPRCGTVMAHGTVGGRTTWWCPREQV